MGDVRIRTMVAADWPTVAAIYQAGIDTGHATFETQAPSWSDFDAIKLSQPRRAAAGRADRSH